MYGVYNMMSYQNPELFTLADPCICVPY